MSEVPEWAQEVRERVVRIETKLDTYNGIREAAYAAKAMGESNERTICKLQEGLTWFWRAIGTAIIGGLVGAYIRVRG